MQRIKSKLTDFESWTQTGQNGIVKILNCSVPLSNNLRSFVNVYERKLIDARVLIYTQAVSSYQTFDIVVL